MRAKPRARVPGITCDGDTVVVAVRERAVDGAANDAIERAVAAWLGLPKSAVAIDGGETSRHKRLRIDGITAAELAAAVSAL